MRSRLLGNLIHRKRGRKFHQPTPPVTLAMTDIFSHNESSTTRNSQYSQQMADLDNDGFEIDTRSHREARNSNNWNEQQINLLNKIDFKRITKSPSDLFDSDFDNNGFEIETDKFPVQSHLNYDKQEHMNALETTNFNATTDISSNDFKSVEENDELQMDLCRQNKKDNPNTSEARHSYHDNNGFQMDSLNQQVPHTKINNNFGISTDVHNDPFNPDNNNGYLIDAQNGQKDSNRKDSVRQQIHSLENDHGDILKSNELETDGLSRTENGDTTSNHINKDSSNTLPANHCNHTADQSNDSTNELNLNHAYFPIKIEDYLSQDNDESIIL